MKTESDAKRFLRYQAVVNVILGSGSFSKSFIYEVRGDEKPAFIGRVIAQLVKDGYLVQEGKKSRPVYSWTNKRMDFHAGRWIDERAFPATVKRSPSFDRPRERLLRLGPAELKTSELLAILVRSGVPGESAAQVGERLAARFGDNLQALSLKARGELKLVSKAIGEAAYCQVMAALELGKRLAAQQTSISGKPRKIRNPGDALAYCREHFGRLAHEKPQEEFHVVLLDEAHRIIKSALVTVGLSDRSLVRPLEVLKPAIQESASAIILVHNHPSGDPTPSQEDVAITKELKAASSFVGIRVLDHIILGKDRITSMAEDKLI